MGYLEDCGCSHSKKGHTGKTLLSRDDDFPIVDQALFPYSFPFFIF